MEQLSNRTQPFTENKTRPFVARVRYSAEALLADAAARGWSDAELARQAAVSQMTVYRVRRGSGRPDTFAKLAAALDQPLSRYIVTEQVA